MSTLLNIAAAFAIIIGIAHSVLGERYILTRLFKRNNLPRLFGGTDFTRNTLRFAWHITTIAWWGFAALLFQLANGAPSPQSVALITGMVFIITGLIALIGSKARHLSWPIFLFIGGTSLYASTL